MYCFNHDRSVNRPGIQNTPSGIAQQLQRTSEQGALQAAAAAADPMNIDDFIFSENAATPAGFSPSPQPAPRPAEFQKPSAAHAIPINSRKAQHHAQQPQHSQSQLQDQIQNQDQNEANQFVPQSVPEPPHHQNTEFGYVKRHHRKTSIDERRVSLAFCIPSFILGSVDIHQCPCLSLYPCFYLCSHASALRSTPGREMQPATRPPPAILTPIPLLAQYSRASSFPCLVCLPVGRGPPRSSSCFAVHHQDNPPPSLTLSRLHFIPAYTTLILLPPIATFCARSTLHIAPAP